MVGARREPAGDGEPAVREHCLAGHAAPELLQLVDACDRGVDGDEGRVERSHRAAHDDVGHDAGLEQRLQGAYLRRAETAATGEDDSLADLRGRPAGGRGSGVTPSTPPQRENRHVAPPTVAPPTPFISARTVFEVSA